MAAKCSQSSQRTKCAKWILALKEKLAANPLYHNVGLGVTCEACGGKGKKVALYQVTNYGSTFNTCGVCGKVYR